MGSKCENAECVLAKWELEKLKHRLMQRHSEASLKWRNQAYYYKRKARLLELFVMSKGFNVDDVLKIVNDPSSQAGESENLNATNSSVSSNKESGSGE